MDRFDRQDYAERWLSDAFRVIQENPPGFLVYVDIEMTRVQALIAELGRCWCVRRDLRWLAIRICISCSLGVGGFIQIEWTSDCLLPMKRWRLR